MRIVEPTTKYLKGRKRCERRGLDLKLLDTVIDIIANRPFTEAEIIKYKVHSLSGKLRGCQELHIGGKNSNWLLVYRITGNKVKFEDTYVVLESTGTHDECLGAYEPDNMGNYLGVIRHQHVRCLHQN